MRVTFKDSPPPSPVATWGQGLGVIKGRLAPGGALVTHLGGNVGSLGAVPQARGLRGGARVDHLLDAHLGEGREGGSKNR